MDNADLLSDMPFVPAQARSVTLFLVDGRADGIVLAAVGNWNGQVLAAPRGRLSALLRRPEASRTGIYLLLARILTGRTVSLPTLVRLTTSPSGSVSTCTVRIRTSSTGWPLSPALMQA
jgi:hypothetical protein